MPEYLAPGVYVEEVSFRAKSIEGVPTSTTGFAGVARSGPVQYTGGPTTTKPRLITSFTEYERVYGSLQPVQLASGERVNYMAHAVRAFFNNGGRRVYISRVFAPAPGKLPADSCARMPVVTTLGSAAWVARWPGDDGNVLVDTRTVRSKNLAFKWPNDPNDILQKHLWGVQVRTAKAGAVVELTLPPGPAPIANAPLAGANLFVVETDSDGHQFFIDSTGNPALLPDVPGVAVSLVELRVVVYQGSERADNYEYLAAHPAQRRFIGKVLERDDPEDENSLVWLDWAPGASRFAAASLMMGLQSADKRLFGGNDGDLPSPDDLRGKEADPDNVLLRATGLEALGEIEDIAIVALPDAGDLAGDKELSQAAADHLIAHAEKERYRIAVVDAPYGSSISEIREFRGKFDTKYGALYHPWIEILDPLFPVVPGVPPRKLLLPPSGFVCGIYARSDIERGVHKAPANEVVRGLTKFELNINRARQDVLNPEGVNCLRFFEGRGSRVWGARTMSSDPEWKYVNVRRLFIYIEHSIDKATQWAVFEPNNDRLWANIRRMVEDFMFVLWRDGALIGQKPEEAYFVRCDRTTMTQNDLDNGRMICLVGLAPSRPAEYVIFRVGQWTADSKV
ncbi:phage tail sheath subtilisin-like domain-containing protein [Ramlibacter sp. XY19]|uniref:phage tail sheath family protein n=1 Tax=Ramlibacter paludis TaxID=2908000 RepID=UPI0023DB2FAF|nr:phage tail sheath subtilisin-like domain-containing protein [Ramlibacter paludis]MCG2593179.1 phage tail sheath subtilisin-like domain-containing protein [Ramlibacter paludis]